MFPDDVKRIALSPQRGFGLPMALFVITVLAVIVTVMGSMQTTSGQSSVLLVGRLIHESMILFELRQ